MENKTSLVLIEAVCFLYSLFEVDKERYNKTYNDFLSKAIISFYKCLNDFLIGKNKKALNTICALQVF